MTTWRDIAHPVATLLLWAAIVGLTLYGIASCLTR